MTGVRLQYRCLFGLPGVADMIFTNEGARDSLVVVHGLKNVFRKGRHRCKMLHVGAHERGTYLPIQICKGQQLRLRLLLQGR